MEKADTSYETQIQILEEQLMFLDKHVTEQDKVIMNLQKKLDKTAQELKDLRVHFQSGALSTGTADEKPPHY